MEVEGRGTEESRTIVGMAMAEQRASWLEMV